MTILTARTLPMLAFAVATSLSAGIAYADDAMKADAMASDADAIADCKETDQMKKDEAMKACDDMGTMKSDGGMMKPDAMGADTMKPDDAMKPAGSN